MTDRRVRAADSKDSLGRPKDCAEKSINFAGRSDAPVAHLLQVSDINAPDPWIADITEYRNLFLHREHKGAVTKWLVMEERKSSIAPVRTVTMAINTRQGAEETCDALVRLPIHTHDCAAWQISQQLLHLMPLSLRRSSRQALDLFEPISVRLLRLSRKIMSQNADIL
jgi:hypothetical protein